MTLNTDEFVAEVNTAIDQIQADQSGGEAKAEETSTPLTGEVKEEKAEDKSAESSEANDGQQPDGGKAASGEESAPAADSSADAPESKAPAAKVAISDAALTEAVRAGIPLEDARLFGSDAALMRVVGAVRAAAEAASVREEDTEQESDPFADLPKLDPEQYEPEVIAMFDKLTGIVRQQYDRIKSFESQQQGVVQSTQQATAREVEQWFDKQVESLGEEFTDALGVGGYSSLDRGSAQFAKRDQIAQQMAVLLSGYNASGLAVPPREQVFDQAAKIVLANEYRTIGERKLSADLAKRSKQHIARVGGQGSKQVKSPEEETAALIDQKFFAKS